MRKREGSGTHCQLTLGGWQAAWADRCLSAALLSLSSKTTCYYWQTRKRSTWRSGVESKPAASHGDDDHSSHLLHSSSPPPSPHPPIQCCRHRCPTALHCSSQAKSKRKKYVTVTRHALFLCFQLPLIYFSFDLAGVFVYAEQKSFRFSQSFIVWAGFCFLWQAVMHLSLPLDADNNEWSFIGKTKRTSIQKCFLKVHSNHGMVDLLQNEAEWLLDKDNLFNNHLV